MEPWQGGREVDFQLWGGWQLLTLAETKQLHWQSLEFTKTQRLSNIYICWRGYVGGQIVMLLLGPQIHSVCVEF